MLQDVSNKIQVDVYSKPEVLEQFAEELSFAGLRGRRDYYDLNRLRATNQQAWYVWAEDIDSFHFRYTSHWPLDDQLIVNLSIRYPDLVFTHLFVKHNHSIYGAGFYMNGKLLGDFKRLDTNIDPEARHLPQEASVAYRINRVFWWEHVLNSQMNNPNISEERVARTREGLKWCKMFVRSGDPKWCWADPFDWDELINKWEASFYKDDLELTLNPLTKEAENG